MVSINFEAGTGTNEKVGGGTITAKPKDLYVDHVITTNQLVTSL